MIGSDDATKARTSDDAAPAPLPPDNPLSDAAYRALDEAETRRRKLGDGPASPRELYGRAGPEPVRYGDWEVKGLATDF